MTGLQLAVRRHPDRRRSYEVDGLGTLRYPGIRQKVIIEAPGHAPWVTHQRSLLSKVYDALDADGRVVVTGDAGQGRILHGDRELVFAERPRRNEDPWQLSEGGRLVATFEFREWGRRPVGLTFTDAGADPRLLLFCAWVANLMTRSADIARTQVNYTH